MSARKPRPAEAAIVGKDILIRLPIRSIAIAVEHADRQAESPMRVTDTSVFAKEVCRALNREQEDGTTPIHRLFDDAFWAAGDDGAQGVEFGDIDDDGNAMFPGGGAQ